MPEEITLEDGTTRTVHTEEEVKGYQKGAEKNKERKEHIAKLGESLELKEDQTIDDKINELKELSNPNFAKYRAKHKAMEKELKEAGKEFNDNGTLSNGNQPLSSEDIQKQIDEKVRETVSSYTNSSVKEKALSNFTKEDQDVIKPHLDKLTNVYPDDLQGNLEMAVQKAFPSGAPDAIHQTLSSAGGGAPRLTNPKDTNFTETEEGKELLSKFLPPEVKKAQEKKQ